MILYIIVTTLIIITIPIYGEGVGVDTMYYINEIDFIGKTLTLCTIIGFFFNLKEENIFQIE